MERVESHRVEIIRDGKAVLVREPDGTLAIVVCDAIEVEIELSVTLRIITALVSEIEELRKIDSDRSQGTGPSKSVVVS